MEQEPGGPIDPEPIDPLDGEGGNPPGAPDQTRLWIAPATLGNGLVHDSRFDLAAGEYAQTFSALELAAGVEWSGFVSSHAQKVERGFRPSALDAVPRLTDLGGGTFELGIRDRSVYVSDDDASYRTETKTYVFADLAAEQQGLTASGPSAPGQARPTSVDSFSFPGGEVGTSVAWVYDDNPMPWKLVISEDAQTFDTTLSELTAADYRAISISSRTRDAASEYSAVFVQDGAPAVESKVVIGQDWADLSANFQAIWDAGFYPFRGSYEHGSEASPTFNVLWSKRSPELELQLRYNMDEPLFNAEDIAWRKLGYQLENACAYSDTGVTRYAGLWLRSEPYLRWEEGLSVDETSPAYIDRYQPFHDAAIKAMTLEGAWNEGDFFRPSATLHIFEGQQLVINRAYTYAPAIYPDTQLDASIGTASASKSITAAAVVRELNVQNIQLTAAFAGAAGINNVPNMAAAPSVAQVLGNVGGFRKAPTSYGDHTLVGARLVRARKLGRVGGGNRRLHVPRTLQPQLRFYSRLPRQCKRKWIWRPPEPAARHAKQRMEYGEFSDQHPGQAFSLRR